MKTYIRFKSIKIRLKNIKQTEPQQKYRIGTISNIQLLGGLNRFYTYMYEKVSDQVELQRTLEGKRCHKN